MSVKRVIMGLVCVMVVMLLVGCSVDAGQTDQVAVVEGAALPEVKLFINDVEIEPGVDTAILEADAIVLKASSDVKITDVVYRVATGEAVKVTGSEAVVEIPAEFYGKGSFSINCYAIDEKGNASIWKQFTLNAQSDESGSSLAAVVKTRPALMVMAADTVLEPGVDYTVVSGNALKIMATHVDGISKIVYRLGNSEEVTFEGSSVTVYLPEEWRGTGVFSLNCYAVTEKGVASLWEQYLLEFE